MDSTESQHPQQSQTRAALTLAALGIVYGDIGTSVLYAATEVFNPAHGIPLDTGPIIGRLSAIFWSLMVLVSLQSVTLVIPAASTGGG